MEFSIRDLEFKRDYGLCGSCKHSHCLRTAKGKTFIQCEMLKAPANNITEPVESCSEFDEHGTMARWELEQIAWVLEVKKGKTIGFVSPAERSKRDGTTEGTPAV